MKSSFASILALAAAAAAPALGAAEISGHLVHRFTFDGNAVDSVDSALTATVVGCSYTSDSKAIRFSKGACTDSYVQLPANLLPTTTGEATIEIFFKPVDRPKWTKLFSIGNGNGSNVSFHMNWDGNDWTTSIVNGDNAGDWQSGSGNIADGHEYHLVCSLKDGTCAQFMLSDRTDGTYGFQVNQAWNWKLSEFGQGIAHIGRTEWGDDTAEMEVSEVRIWNYAFSQDDAKASAQCGPDETPASFAGNRDYIVANWNGRASLIDDVDVAESSKLSKWGNGLVTLNGTYSGFEEYEVDNGTLGARLGKGLPADCHITLNSGAWAPLTNYCSVSVGTGPGQISTMNGHKLHFVAVDQPLTIDFGGAGADFDIGNAEGCTDNIYFNNYLNNSYTCQPVTLSNRVTNLQNIYIGESSLTLAKGFSGTGSTDTWLHGGGTIVVPNAGDKRDEYGDVWSYYSMKLCDALTVNVSGKLNARGWELDVYDNATLNVLQGGETTSPVLWVGHDNGLTGYHATMNLDGGTVTVRGWDGATQGWGDEGFIVGNDTGCDATFNLNSGSLAVDFGNMHIGRVGDGARGYFNQTGGTATFAAWGAIGRYEGAYGEMNISGGTSTMTAADKAMTIAEDQSEGHLNVSGTGAFIANGFIRVGGNQGKARISVTENGKVVAKRIWSENRSNDNEVSIDGGTVEFTAGGGQLGNVSNLLFGAAGGKIDVGGNNVVLSPDSITGGTLVKKGEGTLAISSATQFDAAGIDVAEGAFAVPNAVPIHRYRFDGSLTDDYSSEFTATLHGSTALTEDNKAVDVGYAENNDNYISFKEEGQGGFLPESGDMTIECWFTVNEDVPGWAKLFVTGSGQGNNIIITLNSGAHDGNMCITYGGQNYSANEEGNRKFEKGHRYHVVFTMRETSSGNSDIYLIKEDLTDPTLNGSIYLPSYGLALNMLEENAAWIAHNWWNNWTAGMTIEEFRVWDRFFDADDVAASKKAGPDALPQLPALSCPVTIRQGGVLACSGTADLRGSVITYESAEWLETYFRQNRSASLPMIQASEILTDDQTFSGIPARKGYVLRERNGVTYLEWRGGLVVTIR